MNRAGAFPGLVLLSLLAAAAAGPPARAADGGPAGADLPAGEADPLVGREAPPFRLPRIGGGPEVASDTLYYAYGATLMVFWTTHCAECTHRLESCQTLYEWGAPRGLDVVAINFDEAPSTKIRVLAERTSPDLLHLYDPGGRVTASFGAGAHSFTALLIDETGIVRRVYYEILPAGLRALEPQIAAMLDAAFAGEPNEAAAEEVPVPAPGDRGGVRPGLLEELGLLRAEKISLHGRGRLRWMSIETSGRGAVGSFGDTLRAGHSLRHRMDLELGYAVTPDLVAGGLIRLSNEGPAVLRGGPDYLSTEWGSFFLRYHVRGKLPALGRFETRLLGGFYRIYFTPLTLMRWDQDDTPISGGQRAQGCGVCGGEAGAAGFIRTESLEKLSPDLGFEGARLDLSAAGFDLTALYARPQTAAPADPEDCQSEDFARADTYYAQELFGGRLTRHLAVPWGPEPVAVSLHAVMTQNDENDPPCSPSWMLHAPYRDAVGSIALVVPLPARLALSGELAASRWTPDLVRRPDQTVDGAAGQAMLAAELRAGGSRPALGDLRARFELAYQRLGGDFYSPFSALSYESNLRGPRASLRIDWGPFGVGGFYKRLDAIEAVAGPLHAPEVDDTKTTSSIWVDAGLWPGGVLMIGGVFEDRRLYDPGVHTGALGPRQSDILILSLEQSLANRCTLMLEGEWSDGQWTEGLEDPSRAVTNDYTSSIVRVLMDVEF